MVSQVFNMNGGRDEFEDVCAETDAGLGLLQKSPSLQRLTLDVVPCHAMFE